MFSDIRSMHPSALLGELNEIEQKYAPKQLFVRGDQNFLKGYNRVSIVGSRKASEAGIQRARSMAKQLAESEIVVVSGLAEGVDTAAHTACMEAGGKTVAVIGTPLDKSFPAKNKDLQESIATEHLLVSQFAIGSSGGRWTFPARNRTMALLTDATIIIEAGKSSGTKSQGWEALRLGRRLFLSKAFMEDSAPEWAEKQIEYGAIVLGDDNLERLIDELPFHASGDTDDAIAM